MTTGAPRTLASLFALDPAFTFLNHGSFGACLREVLDVQSALRARMEAQPVRFFLREVEPLLDAARAELARFVNGDEAGLVFLNNATTAVSTVLASLDFGEGAELLTTDHVYGACRNALAREAERRGARLVVAHVPFPVEGPEAVERALLERVTERTALVLLDHVTSPTALIFPVSEIATRLAERGIPLLVDGAHAPGMLPVDLRALEASGVAFYTANLHKWCGAPKGAAFLSVREDHRARVRPLVTSHGASASREGRSRLHLEFDWTGTDDPTPWLAVPAALRALEALAPGGVDEVQRRNRALVLAGRRLLCEALGTPPPCPDRMIGSMATVHVPEDLSAPRGFRPVAPPVTLAEIDPLQDWLFAERVEVPVFAFAGRRCLRISAQRYNDLGDYERLAELLARGDRAQARP